MFIFFFFNDTATTEIYTLSLHDALPISQLPSGSTLLTVTKSEREATLLDLVAWSSRRSEEHTSELQSRQYLVCRLLLEKKKKNNKSQSHNHSIALPSCYSLHTPIMMIVS